MVTNDTPDPPPDNRPLCEAINKICTKEKPWHEAMPFPSGAMVFHPAAKEVAHDIIECPFCGLQWQRPLDVVEPSPDPAPAPADALAIWTVYRPTTSDRPGQWVARLSYVDKAGIRPTRTVITGTTLAAVRAELPPGLTRLARQPDDDIVIEEIWL